MTYSVRTRPVVVGRTGRDVLAAGFQAADGTEVLLQLADEGDLRRGGVYVLGPGATAAYAPRFDELFRDVAAKAADAGARSTLRKLVSRAKDACLATLPRLTPESLAGLERLAAACARLERVRGRPRVGLPLDVLALVLALIFASEEERYPRPRYKGCDVAVGRLLELIPLVGSSPSSS